MEFEKEDEHFKKAVTQGARLDSTVDNLREIAMSLKKISDDYGRSAISRKIDAVALLLVRQIKVIEGD